MYARLPIARRFRRRDEFTRLIPVLAPDSQRPLHFVRALGSPVLCHFSHHLIHRRLSRATGLRQPRQVCLGPPDRSVPHLLVEFGRNRLV